jgi:hypothetical protein
MIRCLRCLLMGHEWEWRAVSVPGWDKTMWLCMDNDRRYARYGFTLVTLTCKRCTRMRQRTLLGVIGEVSRPDEVLELRKMAGLE